MSTQQTQQQPRQCQSVPLVFETIKEQFKRSVSLLNPEIEQVLDEIEDESDWEIFSILTGNTEIDDILIVYNGNEDVILHDLVQQLQRCSAPCNF